MGVGSRVGQCLPSELNGTAKARGAEDGSMGGWWTGCCWRGQTPGHGLKIMPTPPDLSCPISPSSLASHCFPLPYPNGAKESIDSLVTFPRPAQVCRVKNRTRVKQSEARKRLKRISRVKSKKSPARPNKRCLSCPILPFRPEPANPPVHSHNSPRLFLGPPGFTPQKQASTASLHRLRFATPRTQTYSPP